LAATRSEEPLGHMNIRMRGENAVPIMIAHVNVTKEPQVQRTRRFVGLRAGLRSLALKAIEAIHESFWEVETEILEAGEHDTVYYGIQVLDDPGAEGPELHVSRLDPKMRPGAGAYVEVINLIESKEEEMTPPTQPESRARAVGKRPRRPGETDVT